MIKTIQYVLEKLNLHYMVQDKPPWQVRPVQMKLAAITEWGGIYHIQLDVDGGMIARQFDRNVSKTLCLFCHFEQVIITPVSLYELFLEVRTNVR